MQIKKGRCLIPASHFFELTGTKPPKSKWRFTKAGEDWFCFAGLWRPMPDAGGDAFTLPAALLEAARSLRPARSRGWRQPKELSQIPLGREARSASSGGHGGTRRNAAKRARPSAPVLIFL
jgi:hypothetical protein